VQLAAPWPTRPDWLRVFVALGIALAAVLAIYAAGCSNDGSREERRAAPERPPVMTGPSGLANLARASREAVAGSENPPAPTPPKPPAELGREEGRRALARGAATVGTISRWTLGISALGLAVSFFVPWIKRSEAAGAFGIGLALNAVQYVILVYGVAAVEVAFWVSVLVAVVAAVAAGYPLITGLVRRANAKTGERLALQDPARHGRDGAALVIASDRRFKNPQARKLLASSLSEGRTVREAAKLVKQLV
jgi:hypothetical protein